MSFSVSGQRASSARPTGGEGRRSRSPAFRRADQGQSRGQTHPQLPPAPAPVDCGVAACAVCRGGPLPPGSQRLLHVAKALRSLPPDEWLRTAPGTTASALVHIMAVSADGHQVTAVLADPRCSVAGAYWLPAALVIHLPDGHPRPTHGTQAFLCMATSAASSARSVELTSHPLSGLYPVPQEQDKRGLLDAGAGIGGFSAAAAFLGLPVVSAIDSNPLVMDLYEALHRSANGPHSVTADLLRRETWFSVSRAAPRFLALGFPCQPFSSAGDRRGLDDGRTRVLEALLVALAILRPSGAVLECVAGFQDLHRGSCRNLLAACLRHVGGGFACWDDRLDLRAVLPIRRPRWLAACPRLKDESTHALLRERLRPASWIPRPSDLRSAGILLPLLQHQDLRLTAAEVDVIQNEDFLPSGFHSRLLHEWAAIPTYTHSTPSLTGPCPCGCRPHGLSAQRLLSRGAFLTMVRTVDGNQRLLGAPELARVLGFPPSTFWFHGPQRLLLAALGNSISPVHAVVPLVKLLAVANADHGARHHLVSDAVDAMLDRNREAWLRLGASLPPFLSAPGQSPWPAGDGSALHLEPHRRHAAPWRMDHGPSGLDRPADFASGDTPRSEDPARGDRRQPLPRSGPPPGPVPGPTS